jgi:hypothetical protein
MSTLTGRLALKHVIEQGWKQLQSGFLNQLRQAIEGLLVAERDESLPRRVLTGLPIIFLIKWPVGCRFRCTRSPGTWMLGLTGLMWGRAALWQSGAKLVHTARPARTKN